MQHKQQGSQIWQFKNIAWLIVIYAPCQYAGCHSAECRGAVPLALALVST